MQTWKKALLIVLAVLMLAVGGLLAAVQLRWNRQRPVLMPDIQASRNPAIIEKGRQFVWGPAHCAGCHGALEQYDEYEATAQVVPLTGGFQLEVPLGGFVAPNLTPDEETGIGRMSDGEIARSLRYGVGRNGTLLFPVMPFANLSDEDLVAIVSYLRSLEPIKKARPAHSINLLGKVIYAFVLEPVGPTSPPPASVPAGSTVEYGKYLAESVANCNGCHTDRDLQTGAYIGKPFAGGLALPHRGKEYKIPNITPGAAGSKLRNYDQTGFRERIHSAKASAPGSPMPWAAFAKMSDEQIDAIWLYLQTVTPVDVDQGPVLAAG